MKREVQKISRLREEATAYGVEFCDGKVTIETPVGNKGSGLFVTHDLVEENKVLVSVPADLVLSLENVWVYSKADRHLSDILGVSEEISRTAKGAIRLFLLLQLTHGATNGDIGVSNFFSTYVKHLPKDFGLPTLWDDHERLLLVGTTLEAATQSKLKNLDREFTLIRERTASIDWCQKHWWGTDTGRLSIEDWKVVDAMYRSRAMDLPGTGSATVPVMDMANHATGAYAKALYETDPEGNAVLLMREGSKLKAGDEITISYGDDNGAAEMLHSYGFIESEMSTAKQLWLDIDIPSDDPLARAKKHAARSAPGFKIFQNVGNTSLDPHLAALYRTGDSVPVYWEGPYVWLINVNEEDGLEFKLLQTNEGETDIQMFWKGTVVNDLSNFESMLSEEPLYEVFKLRVITMLRDRMLDQIARLEDSKTSLADILEAAGEETTNYSNAMKLRQLEGSMLWQAYEGFGEQQAQLAQSGVVQEYLRKMSKDGSDENEEDDFA